MIENKDIHGWKFEFHNGNVVFKKEPLIDPETGVITTFEKRFSSQPLKNRLVRKDAFPNGLVSRLIINGSYNQPYDLTTYIIRRIDSLDSNNKERVSFINTPSRERGDYPINFTFSLGKFPIAKSLAANKFYVDYDSNTGKMINAGVVIQPEENPERTHTAKILENLENDPPRYMCAIFAGDKSHSESVVIDEVIQTSPAADTTFDDRGFSFSVDQEDGKLIVYRPINDQFKIMQLKFRKTIDPVKVVQEITTRNQTGWEDVFDHVAFTAKAR